MEASEHFIEHFPRNPEHFLTDREQLQSCKNSFIISLSFYCVTTGGLKLRKVCEEKIRIRIDHETINLNVER